MREIVVILLVIAVLLGLTAIRYRNQIVSIIRFWRQMQSVRQRINGRDPQSIPNANESDTGIGLVRCTSCGKWVSPAEAVRGISGFVCLNTCNPINAEIRNE